MITIDSLRFWFIWNSYFDALDGIVTQLHQNWISRESNTFNIADTSFASLHTPCKDSKFPELTKLHYNSISCECLATSDFKNIPSDNWVFNNIFLKEAEAHPQNIHHKFDQITVNYTYIPRTSLFGIQLKFELPSSTSQIS